MNWNKAITIALCAMVVTVSVAGLAYAAETSAAAEKVLRHVVMFKFKDGTRPEQIQTVEKAFEALPARITTIAGFEWGTNISTENLSQGFTHCFIVTFKSAEDRDGYLPNPAHKEFAATAGKYLDKVLVVDFWAQK